jgi:hypothetical protein
MFYQLTINLTFENLRRVLTTGNDFDFKIRFISEFKKKQSQNLNEIQNHTQKNVSLI